MGAEWVRGSGTGCTVAVRVIPRSPRPGVLVEERGLVIRVQAAPEGGRATDEARRRLADALGVPPSAVRLRTGMTSRAKAFEVAGLGPEDVRARIRHA
ncbi:MAG TPA: DUF167 domain-containing protein [Actinomycetota bacterium]